MLTGPDGTVYAKFAQRNGMFAVKILPIGGGVPQQVDGFKSEKEAEEWIYGRMTDERADTGPNPPQYAGPPTTPKNP
jgi:hypothetical protein